MLDLQRYHNAISGVQRPDISKENWLKTTVRFLAGKTPGIKPKISLDLAKQIINTMVPVYNNEMEQKTFIIFTNNVIYSAKADSFIIFFTPSHVAYLKGWLALEATDLSNGENGFLFKFTDNQFFKIVEAKQEYGDFDNRYFVGDTIEALENFAKKHESKAFGVGHRFSINGEF